MEIIISEFKKKFPTYNNIFIAQASGRLNIIGEHTDYSGLPVLPFAINASTKICFSPTKNKTIKLYSLNLPKSSSVEFQIEEKIPHSKNGSWANYIKAAVQDGVNYAKEKNIPIDKLNGFVGVVESDIPMNAGLSSSSALVVASELAFFETQGWSLEPLEMALRTARAEHYVGTMGGGMDQATSLCGKKNHCLKIYFNPLEISLIPLKTNSAFIIANSLVDARKSNEVKDQYNQRVLESRLIKEIASVIFLKTGLIDSEINYLGDIRRISKDSLNINCWKNAILNELDKEYYSIEELEKICGKECFEKNIYPLFSGLLKVLPNHFPIKKRAKYLFEEWERVESAAEFLKEGKAELLGKLLYESHDGLKNLLEVSHPKLDELVELSKRFGIYGARMVGAGFGGSTLHLVSETDEDEYIQFLTKNFYSIQKISPQQKNYIQKYTPSEGANVTQVFHINDLINQNPSPDYFLP